MRKIIRLEMLLPFDDSFDYLAAEDQLLKLKGCALCSITRRVDEGSPEPKPEWLECRAAIGVPVG